MSDSEGLFLCRDKTPCWNAQRIKDAEKRIQQLEEDGSARVVQLARELVADMGEKLDEVRQERDAQEVRIQQLRRALDNIKIRAYELGQPELHDMALAALKETDNG